MNQIAIQDANILIDLLAIGMFDHCLAAACQFITTDIILAELYEHQVDLIQPYIHSGRFSVIAITAEELLEIQSLSLEDERLSIQDWLNGAYHFSPTPITDNPTLFIVTLSAILNNGTSLL